MRLPRLVALSGSLLLLVPWPQLASAGAPACTQIGTAGQDMLTGTPGVDVLCGRGGDDELRASGGTTSCGAVGAVTS
jgi:Ca2+-binding RTX toxin-like protein